MVQNRKSKRYQTGTAVRIRYLRQCATSCDKISDTKGPDYRDPLLLLPVDDNLSVVLRIEW